MKNLSNSFYQLKIYFYFMFLRRLASEAEEEDFLAPETTFYSLFRKSMSSTSAFTKCFPFFTKNREQLETVKFILCFVSEREIFEQLNDGEILDFKNQGRVFMASARLGRIRLENTSMVMVLWPLCFTKHLIGSLAKENFPKNQPTLESEGDFRINLIKTNLGFIPLRRKLDVLRLFYERFLYRVEYS